MRRFDPGCATILLTGFATVELAVDVLTGYNALSCLRKEVFNRAEFRALVRRVLTGAPKVEAVPSAHAPVAEAGAASTETPAQGRVLVVEDDAGWRSILSELLFKYGVTLLCKLNRRIS